MKNIWHFFPCFLIFSDFFFSLDFTRQNSWMVWNLWVWIHAIKFDGFIKNRSFFDVELKTEEENHTHTQNLNRYVYVWCYIKLAIRWAIYSITWSSIANVMLVMKKKKLNNFSSYRLTYLTLDRWIGFHKSAKLEPISQIISRQFLPESCFCNFLIILVLLEFLFVFLFGWSVHLFY